ncbi:MAG: hypothetical protein JWP02_2266 [Acidimicrobiales bacterium]|nr:hypothetical protein [Acidimicrobiales bacterium]
MTTGLAERAQSTLNRDEGRTWAERAGRIGLCARGVIYCVVAVLVLQVATGNGGRADRQGALKAVADEPLGKVLLVILAAGFASYAVWRFAKAATGSGEGSGAERGGSGALKRLADVGRGLIYVSLLYSTVRLLVSGQPGKGSDDEAKSWSARLMTHDAGRWLVIAAGGALVVVGIVLVVRALAHKFEKHLKVGDMTSWERTWLPRLGIFGYAARGVVAAAAGVFIAQAGVTFDPQKAVGIDGALKRLADQPYGPVLLVLVAFGLLGFGLYSFVEARWRKVLDT